MHKIVGIVSLICGLFCFSTSIYMIEHIDEIRVSKLPNPEPPKFKTDIPHGAVIIGKVTVEKASEIKESGATRSRNFIGSTKEIPMAQMQSSVVLKWMTNSDLEEAMEFGNLRDDHESKSPEYKERKNGNGWKLIKE